MMTILSKLLGVSWRKLAIMILYFNLLKKRIYGVYEIYQKYCKIQYSLNKILSVATNYVS